MNLVILAYPWKLSLEEDGARVREPGGHPHWKRSEQGETSF